MGLLLDLGYAAAGLLLSPYLIYRCATEPRFRRGLGERFGGVPRREGDRPCLWLHCSSVGEVHLVKPLVGEVRARIPDVDLHVSMYTPSGREAARQAYPDARVHYFPLDFSLAVSRALRRVRPDAIVLVELEVWPNFVRAAARRRVPVAIVNGRISHRSHRRYRRAGWFFRRVFRRLAWVGAQTPAYAERLQALGVPADRVAVMGNLKYDALIDFDPESAARDARGAFGLEPDEPLLVAGSTHDPEERILCETYKRIQRTHPRLRLLLAPRHVERADEVERLVRAAGFPPARRSRLAPAAPSDAVLILDTVGELARTYAAATVVFIGGTYCARGGQNMLEPAALGKPIVSGPSLENFRQIADRLIEAGAMRVLDNPIDLAMAIGELLRNPERAVEAGLKGRQVAEAGRGAVRAAADRVCSLLDQRS